MSFHLTQSLILNLSNQGACHRTFISISFSFSSPRRYRRSHCVGGLHVHCLLTPVVISLFPDIIPYLPGDASFHRWLAIGIVMFGFAGFVPGYMVHRRKPLLALIGTGMSLILFVAWKGESLHLAMELVLSIGGSMLLVMAHLLNRSFCRQCRICKEEPKNCQTTEVEQMQPRC